MNQGPYGYGPNHNQPPQSPYGYGPPQAPVIVNNVIQKAPFNHTIHIVLDVVTCGGWLIIHLICWALH